MREYTVKELIKLYKKNGWEIKAMGTHIKMCKDGVNYTASIPNHGKTVSLPLARRLLKESGITGL